MTYRKIVSVTAVLLLGCASSQAASTVVAHYKMGESEVAGGATVGGTAANLLPTIGAINMSVSGAPSLQEGGPDTARGGSTHFMRFDGVTQRYEVTPNLLGSTTTSGWMIEAWVRPQAGGSGLGMIVSHGNGSTGQILNYDATANRYGWFVGGTGQFNGSIGATAIGTSWDHLALVREGGTTTLYVNGIFAGSNTASGGSSYVNGTAIGSQYTGGANHGFTGDIDEVYYSTVSGFNVLNDLHMTNPSDPLIVVPSLPQDAGTIIVGETALFDVFIDNTGAENTLTISSVTGLAGDTGKFALQTALPLDILPGEPGTLTFEYTPGATAATHTATFTIGNNDVKNPNPSVTLTGTAITDPNFEVPSTLSFGTVSATGGVTSRALVVSNTGTNEELTLSAAIVSGDTGFFTASSVPSPISPGAQSDLMIDYDPQGNLGSHEAVLEITHNDPDLASPLQITLSGTSVPRFSTIARYKLGEDDTGLATSLDAAGDYDLTNINVTPGTSYNAGSGTAGSTKGIDNALNDVYRHVGVPAELAGRTGNWGMQAWIRPELATGSSQMGSGYGGLYFGVGNGSRGGFSIFSLDGSQWGMNIGGLALANSVAPIEGGTWTHVAAVALDNEIRLYVNGVLAHIHTGSAYAPNDNGAHSPFIEIGGQVANSYRTAGGLDEASIFSFVSGHFNPATDLHVTPPADVDGDGLVDLWEDQYFGNNDATVTWGDLTATDGSGNADGDALTDQEEHDGDSDPTNANDPDPQAPLVTGTSKSGTTCTVSFVGVDGQTYVLKKSVTLNDGFPAEVDSITLTGTSTGTLEDTEASEARAFYRVETTEDP